MEEPPLVSLNTMSVRQTFWGRTCASRPLQPIQDGAPASN